MDWKKLAWRFARGAAYVFAAGLTVKYDPLLTPILGPGVVASAAGGLLLALDKHFGFGRLVAAAKP